MAAEKKKRKYTKKPKKATVKAHATQVWSLFVWAKNNPWVFAIIAGFWGTAVTGLVHVSVKLLTPVVIPMIDAELKEKAIPFILRIDSLQARIEVLETK